MHRDATQVVPGEGRKSAHFMIVGEQPGDQKDLAGVPFVGPAGRLLVVRSPMRGSIAAIVS